MRSDRKRGNKRPSICLSQRDRNSVWNEKTWVKKKSLLFCRKCQPKSSDHEIDTRKVPTKRQSSHFNLLYVARLKKRLYPETLQSSEEGVKMTVVCVREPTSRSSFRSLRPQFRRDGHVNCDIHYKPRPNQRDRHPIAVFFFPVCQLYFTLCSPLAAQSSLDPESCLLQTSTACLRPQTVLWC